MKKVIWSGLILFYPVLSGALTLEAAKGRTEFQAVGRPSAIKINGKGQGPTGELSLKKTADGYLLSGEAIVDLSSLETGIGMRDRHMKDTYLEVEKFKQARLTFKDARISAGMIAGGGAVSVPGELELHGRRNKVDVDVSVTSGPLNLMAESKFTVKLSDFDIAIPKFSGITVADEVRITTETEMSKKALGEGT